MARPDDIRDLTFGISSNLGHVRKLDKFGNFRNVGRSENAGRLRKAQDRLGNSSNFRNIRELRKLADSWNAWENFEESARGRKLRNIQAIWET